MYGNYKSPFGYENGENGGVDSYGVDHSGFSTQDELQYQNARTKREQQLALYLLRQGVTQGDYPQYGTDFWGNSANNYGFGFRNIAQNAQNHQAMNMTPMTGLPQQQNDDSNEVNGQQDVWSSVKKLAQNTVNAVAPYTPTYYVGYSVGMAQNTFNKLKDLYGAYKQNGATVAAQQYGEPSVRQAMKAADWLSSVPISDVNKHQYVSCVGSTGGLLAMAETLAGGAKKEIDDYNKKMNNEDLLKQYGGKLGVIGDGIKDLGNDVIGAWKGLWTDNSEECEELLPMQYRKKKRYW